MIYEAGQRFLTADGRLVELRCNVADVTVEEGYATRLYFIRVCDRQYNNSEYIAIKDCTMLTKPSKTVFLEYLNTLPYPQKYLDELANKKCIKNVGNYTESIPFGNWLRRNHYYEYAEMYIEWAQKQPWFTGIIEEDKFV